MSPLAQRERQFDGRETLTGSAVHYPSPKSFALRRETPCVAALTTPANCLTTSRKPSPPPWAERTAVRGFPPSRASSGFPDSRENGVAWQSGETSRAGGFPAPCKLALPLGEPLGVEAHGTPNFVRIVFVLEPKPIQYKGLNPPYTS